MGVELSRIKLAQPSYFHREYQNDLPKKGSEDKGACNQLLRVAQVALPFVALYKPFGQSLAFVMGGSRIFSCLTKTYGGVVEGKSKAEISSDMFHTAVAVASFTGTIFAHPLGMIVTTCHDLRINVVHLHQAWVEKDALKAREAGLQILNTSVYLGILIVGSNEVLVASLVLQIFTGIYQTSAEFQKGNYLEVGAGVLMATIRMNQMVQPISLLKAKWRLESLSKRAANMEAIANCSTAKSEIINSSQTPIIKKSGQISPAALDVILKYGSNPKNISPLHYAIETKDFISAEILIKEGLYLETIDMVETLEKNWRRNATPAVAILLLSLDQNDPTITKNCDKLLMLCFEKINLTFTFTLSSHKYNYKAGWVGMGSQEVDQSLYLFNAINNRFYYHWVHYKDFNKNDCLSMLSILINRGIDINVIPNLLQGYLYACDIEGVRFFIDRGYVIKGRDCLTWLSETVARSTQQFNSSGIIEMIKYLQSKGLDLNTPASSNSKMSQLDACLKKIISVPDMAQEIKQDLITYLLSIGAKI